MIIFCESCVCKDLCGLNNRNMAKSFLAPSLIGQHLVRRQVVPFVRTLSDLFATHKFYVVKAYVGGMSLF